EADEIVVAAGLYRETVDLRGKNLTVRSEDPNDPNVVAATVIDGSVQSVVFAGGETEDCVLAGFTITGAQQGIYCDAATPTILNCRIAGNTEAGVKLAESCDPTLTNCIIEGNGGAGIAMEAPRGARFTPYNYATIVHCTIVGNAQGGVLGDKPTIVNSILCDNGLGPDIPQVDGVVLTVDYCLVQGGCPGTGNIDDDPGFVTPGYWTEPTEPDGTGATWVAGDCHLLGDSPCVDAGDPDFVVDIATDIDGDPRRAGPRPDLGCDEVRVE
ncbi:MAG: right-handed parallel beta-helix repeat-containing protein, partial [Planctomycetota bacterium]